MPWLRLMTSDPTNTSGRDDAPLRIGEVIDGNYTMRRVIGSGGMGQVYEAHDESLNRIIAIKMAWTSVDAEQLLAEDLVARYTVTQLLFFFAQIRRLARA